MLLFILVSSRFNLSTAIGVTNQRETTIVWDKETGEPLYNAIGKYHYLTSECYLCYI